MTDHPDLPSQTDAGPLLASVVICTRDRAQSLTRTLESVVQAVAVARRDVPQARWELLVVDNGSTDNTQEVVAGFADRLPIRSVVHPVPGLSNARNAAIDRVAGRYLLWTDDDVLVDESWLSAYLTAFQTYPDTQIFGGRAVPRYQQPVTDWFVANEPSLSSLLAIRDTPDWVDIAPGRLPFGLNYAVRTDVQQRHRYDPDLGVAPGRRIGGEESMMILAALSDGATGRWVWDATVFHLIPAQRQTLDYVFSYYRSQGLLYPRLDVQPSTPVARSKVFVRLLVTIARKWSVARGLRAMGRENWLLSYTDYARWVGTLDHWRSHRGLSGH
jgi:glycosyltransferase involved in cell wall biosynthesis